MALKLFEFLEHFMIDIFDKIKPFEKTGSIGKILISLENSIFKFHFRN